MNRNSIRLVIAGLVLVLLWSVVSYNRFVTAGEAVHAAWGQVRNVEQRRMDLIPALVEVTEAYATHERTTLHALARARAAYLASAAELAAVRQLEEVDAAVIAVVGLTEQYPSLRASDLYRNLEYELRGAENRVAVERQRYNAAAARHRTLTRQFPWSVFARWVEPAPVFSQASPGASVSDAH